ncbi:MAG: L-serine ammonia-lyase [Eubacteriales bacterium]
MRSQGERIKKLRKSKNITQKELASALGISEQAVSKWEKNLSNPSTKHLLKIAKIFGVSITYFYQPEETQSKKLEREGGMSSLCELYKIGRGPSSSHTIGPERACLRFKSEHPADSYRAILYGSLSKTGKGHGTDYVIKQTFLPAPCEVEFDFDYVCKTHPNTMDLIALDGGKEIFKQRFYSVGGGSIVAEGEKLAKSEMIYPLDTFKDIAEYCRERKIRIWEYAFEIEGEGFYAHMQNIWDAMKHSIIAGLNDEGILPGGLGVHKKAKQLLGAIKEGENAETRENRLVCAYAFAVGEQNAGGEKIVTAPTCGAAGVLPAVMFYHQEKKGASDDDIIKALTTAGVIGNLIKHNASISGAECGCQAEVGSACAMAAGALAELYGMDIDEIEYAAEIALEHHLGLTCDPICGLVQIPCIERNAVAAMRAINAANLATLLFDTRKISFDKVVIAMKETGDDMSPAYKETSEAGLAKISVK